MNRFLVLALLFSCGSNNDVGTDAPLPGDAPTSSPDVMSPDAAPPDAALGVCASGGIPSTELCDGVLDEDCDGTVDDGCTNDPFDAASCGGPAPTAAEALAQLGNMSRKILAPATIAVRTRSCSSTTCGA
ncbi:MAG TPA: hypothetical protein VK427_09725, partial [Kofleriaceae bacterium]|nr:hypothetical protein [Kofleriaceae bacterium]